MTSELLIRPGANDHHVLADLLAPGGASVLLPSDRALVSRLVIDAHVAVQRPELAAAGATSGTPVLIDPLTPLWQGELRDVDKWAALPFGVARKLAAADFDDQHERDGVVDSVIRSQVEQGATAVIPPYVYASGPEDPWFDLNLWFIRAAARHMARNGVRLPLVPVFCGQLQKFADTRSARFGIDRFASVAVDVGPQAIGFCMSPVGSSSDSYAKIVRLFDLAERLRQTGTPVLAWRQGVFGPALVAAGIRGYETGIATRETCDMARSIASRRPPKPGTKKKSGGAALGIYIEPLRRSVSARVGLALLGDRSMRPKVMCDDERCCPNGVSDTIDRRREHALRSRAKELAALDAQPHRDWRLHQIGKDAQAAADLATQANRVLKEAGIPERVNPRAMEELSRVVAFIREQSRKRDAA